MKTILISFLIVSMGLWAMSCTSKKKVLPEGAILKEITFKVDGMTCGGCEYNVKTSLLKLDGVVEASADHKKAEATVSFVEGKVTENQLIEAVNSSGYKATLQK
ncbi:MAG: heavy-metal-associated domain-containing protein [Deltaproteobacteria bacterium]|nr:heavy-metal-associated domain-containing protein [Deltaproteobacteria bacterium]